MGREEVVEEKVKNYIVMYHFIQFRDKTATSGGFWMFSPNSVEQIGEHFEKYVHGTLREASKSYSRHILYNEDITHDRTVVGRSAFAMTIFAQTHDCVAALAPTGFLREVWCSRCDAFIERGEVLLAEGPQVYMQDSRFVDRVDEIFKESLDYPKEQRYTLADVRFSKWGENTDHWYARVGESEDIRDKKGRMKWDTKEEAIEAAKWYLEQKQI